MIALYEKLINDSKENFEVDPQHFMHEMANCTSNFLVKISKKFEFLYVFLIG
jgi:hypothetical protein